MCGNQCDSYYIWCKQGTSDQSDDGVQAFNTQDPGLCRNSTFWREVPCTRYYPTGDIAAKGLRCTGALQNCIYPWYLTSNYHYEAGFIVISLSNY